MTPKTIASTIAGPITLGATYSYILVTSNGAVTSTAQAITGSGVLLNEGTIVGGTGDAVLLTGGSVTNAAGALIHSTDGTGVYVGHYSDTLINQGQISASRYYGVVAAALASVVNLGQGVIEGAISGVVATGGTITNLAQGTITGANAGVYGWGTFINAGTIEGGGTIPRALMLSVDFSNNLLVVDPGAVFGGSVNGGNAISTAVVSTLAFAAGTAAGTFSGLGSHYVNFGQISVEAGAAWTALGTNIIQTGATFANAGTLIVAGSVTDAGILVNSGSLAVGANGVSLVSGQATNAATGTISGLGTPLYGFGTVYNAGIIAAGSTSQDAVRLAGGHDNLVVAQAFGRFTGTVDGGNPVGSSYVSTLELAGSGPLSGIGSQFVNFAQISVPSGAHRKFYGDNTIVAGQTLNDAGHLYITDTFVNAGLLTDSANPIRFFNYYHGPLPTIVNTGTMDAGLDTEGTLVNSGLITQNYNAMLARSGVITNQSGGRIVANIRAVDLASISNFYGTATSLINDGTIGGGVLLLTPVSLAGYPAPVASVLTNLAQGTIVGSTIGVYGVGTVINAGTIEGGAAPIAVSFASGSASLLVADPGAVFIGTIAGGNTVGATVASTLAFAAGTAAGTFSGLGGHYSQFASILVDAGASWTASGVNTLASGYTIADSGTLTLANNLAGAGMVSLGIGGLLALDPHTTVTPSINGLKHGTIELVRDFATITGYGGDQLSLSGGVVLNLYGGYTPSSFQVTNSGGNTFIMACFASGTEITTALGPVPVEVLSTSDRVLTAAGRLAAVRWIGRRRTGLAKHPRPADVMPVRVRAGAFADGLPVRDLVLSPDHAVFVEGRLVPIRHLANNVSIVQERRDSITYWHIELDRHGVILAEGLACESYLDTGNRHAFEGEAALRLHPDFGRDRALAVWQAAGCAPILTDPADPVLRALHTRLLARGRRAAAPARPGEARPGEARPGEGCRPPRRRA